MSRKCPKGYTMVNGVCSNMSTHRRGRHGNQFENPSDPTPMYDLGECYDLIHDQAACHSAGGMTTGNCYSMGGTCCSCFGTGFGSFDWDPNWDATYDCPDYDPNCDWPMNEDHIGPGGAGYTDYQPMLVYGSDYYNHHLSIIQDYMANGQINSYWWNEQCSCQFTCGYDLQNACGAGANLGIGGAGARGGRGW